MHRSMKRIALLFIPLIWSCAEPDSSLTNVEYASFAQEPVLVEDDGFINAEGTNIHDRIKSPDGYLRVWQDSTSFGAHLRYLPVRPDGSEVRYYDGSFKSNDGKYVAVVDLPIGTRDLHQCADAIMRLRAEYLWNQGRYSDIHFNFTNGFKADYVNWMRGQRISVEGNQVTWTGGDNVSNTSQDLWDYLEMVFAFAGSRSLELELERVDPLNMKIGNVLIQGGSPGHAVIVVDMVIHPETGEQMFLLAQSYMPAQEIQVLSNPTDAEISPWYKLNPEGSIFTPEWTFEPTDLMQFPEENL